MASTINATSTGSGGLITTGNSVNQLELQTGDTTRVVIDGSGNVTIQGQGDLRLADSDSSHYVALQAPGTVSSNVTFTLPSADGTSGQVIQTNGSGTLSFVTPAGGSWTYLSSVTASNSATVDLETTFDSTYSMYAMVVSGFVPQNDAVDLRGRYKIGGSYVDANYRTLDMYTNYTTQTFAGSNGTGAFELIVNVGNASGENCNAILYLANPASTSLQKLTMGQGVSVNDAGVATQNLITGLNFSTSAVTGFRFYFSSGNIVSGTARLYGIKNS